MQGDLPKNWIKINLVDHLDYLPTGVPIYAGKKQYFSTGSIKENKVESEGTFTFDEKPSRANRIVKAGDVLQARMKGSEKGILINKELEGHLFSTGFIQIRPDVSIINERYLYYFVKSALFLNQRDEYATGTTQVALTDAGAKKIVFPCAPLEEQNRIISKLDSILGRINVAREKLDEIPKKLTKFKDSILNAAVKGELTKEWREANNNISADSLLFEIEHNRVFRKRTTNINQEFIKLEIPNTWKVTNIDFLADEIVDCPHSTPKWEPSGKICLRTTNFFANKLDLTEVKYVSEKTFKERISRLKPEVGDILYSREGGILGIACLLNTSEDVCLGQRMMMFRVNKRVNEKFICYYLNSPILLKHVNNLIGGSAAPHINVRDIKEYPVPLPPYEEQEEIVKKIEELFLFASNIEIHYNKAKIWFEKLIQSILKKAFLGKLMPQNENEEPNNELLRRIKNFKMESKIRSSKQKKTLQ